MIVIMMMPIIVIIITEATAIIVLLCECQGPRSRFAVLGPATVCGVQVHFHCSVPTDSQRSQQTEDRRISWQPAAALQYGCPRVNFHFINNDENH